MQIDLQRLGTDVFGRHVGVDARVDPDRTDGDPPLAAQFRHRLGEKLDVELEAERGDVAGLLVAEEVAGAADLEVTHRDCETGTELGVVRERRESRTRIRRELRHVGIEEIRVRRDIRAPDAAADLVQLRQAERVGAFDDERVRLRDVQTGLDDRRRHEHIAIAAKERVHLLLQVALAHLAVCDDEAEVRRELLELLRDLVNRLDAVVQIEGLSPSLGLAFERKLDELLVVFGDGRANRTTPLWRGLDDGDVPQPGERHVQRARDRSRAEREHVDLEPKAAQQFLLCDAEALLLIEDHEAQLIRDHVATEDPMRPDEHVDLAHREVREDPLDLGGSAKARHHLDVERKVTEALPERVPVLLGEDRRRGEEEHLLAVDGDGERRADRDLRLAEADVSADEAVHRPRRLEVLLHGLDRRLLILGLPVRKFGLEPFEPLVSQVERHSGGVLPLRVEREQLACKLADAFARAGLEVVPRLATELRQSGRRRVGADVARHLADLLVRNVEPVVSSKRKQ